MLIKNYTTPLLSQITNKAISTNFGSGGSLVTPVILARLIAILWRSLLILGGLAVILYMASGAMMWLTSSGDKAKVEEARNRITAAIIGMAILFSMFALINFIFPAIGFNILRPQVLNNI